MHNSAFLAPFHAYANPNYGIDFTEENLTGALFPSRAIGSAEILPQVNIATGNLVVPTWHASLPQKSGQLSLGMVYNATKAQPWDWNIPKILCNNSDQKQITFKTSDGFVIHFSWDAQSQQFIGPRGFQSDFFITKQDNGNFLLCARKTTHYYLFNSDGNLIEDFDSQGNKTQYTWDFEDNLESIQTDFATYEIKRENDQVTFKRSATDHDAEKTFFTLSFDTQNRLIKTTVPTDVPYEITYNYFDATNQLSSITQSDGSTIAFNYDSKTTQPKLISLQNGSDPAYQFSYPDETQTMITDPSGTQSIAILNNDNFITKFSTSLTHILSCKYRDNGALSKITTPSGDVISRSPLVKNSNGLLREKIVHANDAHCEYQYDPNTFLCLTKKEAIDQSCTQFSVTRFVYEKTKNNLAFTISPLGSVTEYRTTQNSDNTETILISVYQDAFDLSRYGDDEPLYYDTIKNWLQKSRTRLSLKSIQHDTRNLPTKINVYEKWDENGIGIETDGMRVITKTYDDFGNAITTSEKIDNNTVANTEHDFDLLNRQTQSVDAMGYQTNTNFSDANATITSVAPNGKTISAQQDSSSRVCKKTMSTPTSTATRTETINYDPSHQVIITTSSDNQSHIEIEDALCRTIFSVSSENYVTAFQYDDLHHYVQTTRYATPVTLPSGSTICETLLQQCIQQNAQEDIVDYCFSDLRGRPWITIDGCGAITEKKYDLFGNITVEIQYATPITQTELASLVIGNFTRIPESQDYVVSHFYDLEGKKYATQDAAGYVTLYQNNAAGFLVFEQHCATPAERMYGTFVKPVESDQDAQYYFYRNAKNEIVLTANNDGEKYYITTKNYYTNGLMREEKKYANCALSTPSLSSDPNALIPTDSSEDQLVTCEYDLNGKKISEHLELQRKRNITYDNAYNVISESMGDDKTTHTTLAQFNDWGKKTHEAPPLLAEKILTSSDAKTLWESHAHRNIFDDVTGLLVATHDIKPENADNNFNTKTLYFYNRDRKLVLTIGPNGDAKKITPHPFFEKPCRVHRYATAVDISKLPDQGGFVSDTILSLLISDTVHDVIDQFTYDARGDITSHIDPEGAITQFHYHAFGICDQTIESIHTKNDGALITKHKIDGAKKIIKTEKITQSDSITAEFKYENLYSHCTEKKTDDGAAEIWKYSTRGACVSHQTPDHQITTFEQDAFEREIKRTLPLGVSQKTIYNQSERSVETQHISKDGETILNSEKNIKDAFGNIISHTDSENATTTTQYHAENKPIAMQDPAGNTQAMHYDWRNLKEDETHLNADGTYQNKSQFSFDNERQLTSISRDPETLSLETQYLWNTLHQRNAILEPSGAKKEIKYNLRSEVTEHHIALNDSDRLTTEFSRNASGKETLTTQKSSNKNTTHKKQIVHDDFGRVIKTIVDPDQLKLTDSVILNHKNEKVVSIDAKNQRTYFIRNVMGRPRFVVNAAGGVTEYQYNAHQKPVTIIQYSVAIDTQSLTETATESDIIALLRSNDSDRHTTLFYDELDQERFRINHQGAVTEKRYNLRGEALATIHYATPISLDPATLDTNRLIALCKNLRNPDQDRATFRIVDAISQECMMINAESYVTQKIFGQLQNQTTHEIAYALPVSNSETIAALPLSQAISALQTSDEDRHTFWFYDSLQRLQFYVHANGAVTRHDYLANTHHCTKITRFSAPVYFNQYNNDHDFFNALKNIVIDPAKDTIETCAYDAAERLISKTDALGNTEYYTLDGASRIESITTKSGHTWQREYDGADRMTLETSPITTIANTTRDNVTQRLQFQTQTTAVQKKSIYDDNGNLSGFTSNVNGQDEMTVQFGVDALNHPQQTVWNAIATDDPSKPTSLTDRPETLIDLSQSEVHDAFGKCLVKMNTANHPTFFVYDDAGFLIYRVNANGLLIGYTRNIFGECECFTFYHSALPVDLTQYVSTGLTKEIVVANLIFDYERDTHHKQKFDRLGRMVEITRDAKSFYIPNIDPTQEPTIGYGEPCKQKKFNAFSEIKSESVVVSRDEKNNINLSRKKLFWYDRDHKLLATVDAAGICTQYVRNVHGKKIEKIIYANSIPASKNISESTSYDALNKILSALADTTRDHHYCYGRNLANQKTSEYQTHFVPQHWEKNVLVDDPECNVGYTVTRTPDGLIKTKTDMQGNTEIFYYDERRFLIAHALPVRTARNPDGTTTQIRPILYFGCSAHGDRVYRYAPASGCAITLDPTAEIAPKPLSTSDQDQYHLFLRDNKRRIAISENPEHRQKQHTYGKNGKIKRAFHAATNYEKTTPNAAPTKKTNLDEVQFEYNTTEKKILQTELRDHTVLSKTEWKRNVQEQKIAEGPGDGTYPKIWKHDSGGYVFAKQDASGAAVITATNLAGDETVRIQSQTQDLMQTTLADLPTLLDNYDDLINQERVENMVDERGRVTAIFEQAYTDPSDATKVIRPQHQIKHDNFDHKIQTIKPDGSVTDYKRNVLGKTTTQVDRQVAHYQTPQDTALTLSDITTRTGYNPTGVDIGYQDGNGNAHIKISDEVRQTVSLVAGDGTPHFINTLNTFGHAEKVTSASGNTWEKIHTSRGKITSVTLPHDPDFSDPVTWGFEVNEKDAVIAKIPPKNSVTGSIYYSSDFWGENENTFYPEGNAENIVRNRHGDMLQITAVNSDGTTAYSTQYLRDYFSKLLQTISGSGGITQYHYNFIALLTLARGTTLASDAGKIFAFDSTTNTFPTTPVPASLAWIEYYYITSLRNDRIVDKNSPRPQSLKKTFDINRRIVGRNEYALSKNFLTQINSVYNSLGWLLFTQDLGNNNYIFTMRIGHDLASNRIFFNASFTPPTEYNFPVATHLGYNTFDTADRSLVVDGILNKDGIPVAFNDDRLSGYLPPNQGNAYTYVNGLPKTQKFYVLIQLGCWADWYAGSIYINYNHHENVNELYGTLYDHFHIVNTHAPDDFLQVVNLTETYAEVSPPAAVLLQNTANQNGTITESAQNTCVFDCYFSTVDSKFFAFNADQFPGSLTTVSRAQTTDQLTYLFYIHTSGLAISRIKAQRSDRWGVNGIDSEFYFDAQEKRNAITNVACSTASAWRDQATNYYIDTSISGGLLRANVISLAHNNVIVDRQHPFLDAAGHTVALWHTEVTARDEARTFLSPTLMRRSYYHATQTRHRETTVEKNDTWWSLSNKLGLGPDGAASLKAYALVPLSSGQTISTKNIFSNRADEYPPIERFIALLYASVYPALQTPQPPPPPPPHHASFLDLLIEAVVGIVVMCIAQPLIAGVLLAEGSAILTGVSAAIAGALSNAATQGLAIALHDQKEFSLSSMVENAISAGITAGITTGAKINFADLMKKQEYFTAFRDAFALQLSSQLELLCSGMVKKIDFKSMLENTLSTLAQAKSDEILGNTPTAVQHGVDELSSASIGRMFGDHQTFAEELIENAVTDFAQDHAEKFGKQLGAKVEKDLHPYQNHHHDDDHTPHTHAHTFNHTSHNSSHHNPDDHHKTPRIKRPESYAEASQSAHTSSTQNVFSENHRVSGPEDALIDDLWNTYEKRHDHFSDFSHQAQNVWQQSVRSDCAQSDALRDFSDVQSHGAAQQSAFEDSAHETVSHVNPSHISHPTQLGLFLHHAFIASTKEMMLHKDSWLVHAIWNTSLAFSSKKMDAVNHATSTVTKEILDFATYTNIGDRYIDDLDAGRATWGELGNLFGQLTFSAISLEEKAAAKMGIRFLPKHISNSISAGFARALSHLSPQYAYAFAHAGVENFARGAEKDVHEFEHVHFFKSTDKSSGKSVEKNAERAGTRGFKYNEGRADLGYKKDPNVPWSKAGRVKAALLPDRGPIRFIPEKDYDPKNPLKLVGKEGYKDKFGNIWRKGPSRTPGDPFEWDVGLSQRSQNPMKYWSRDGSHLNVSLDGSISHR